MADIPTTQVPPLLLGWESGLLRFGNPSVWDMRGLFEGARFLHGL